MSKYTIIYLWSENYSSGFDFFLLPDKVHLLQSYPILVQSMVQQLLRPWLLGYNHATQKHFKILSIFLNMELAYVSTTLFLLYMKKPIFIPDYLDYDVIVLSLLFYTYFPYFLLTKCVQVKFIFFFWTNLQS